METLNIQTTVTINLDADEINLIANALNKYLNETTSIEMQELIQEVYLDFVGLNESVNGENNA